LAKPYTQILIDTPAISGKPRTNYIAAVPLGATQLELGSLHYVSGGHFYMKGDTGNVK
jgi:hypothetical protein